jgi:hypothetical protein
VCAVDLSSATLPPFEAEGVLIKYSQIAHFSFDHDEPTFCLLFPDEKVLLAAWDRSATLDKLQCYFKAASGARFAVPH